MTPFDGKDNPMALLIYFGILIVVREGLYTGLATGYYGLLPEMFGTYRERADVADKMNIFQVIALVLVSVLPPILWNTSLGWAGMAIGLAVISVIPIYVGFPHLFEREDLKNDTSYPFLQSIKFTFLNRKYFRIMNLPNIGQINNLPNNVVVETYGIIDATGAHAATYGDVPAGVQNILLMHVVNQEMTVKAAMEGSRELALQVLLNDPLSSRLTVSQARQMVEELLES